MARSLIVPGVSVETRFDVPPPLPSRSGILGAVGVVDRVPSGTELEGVTTSGELLERFGPATRFSFPEVMDAIANGVAQVFVSPVDPRSGTAAELTVFDNEEPPQPVAVLRARAVGPWGNDLAARIVRTLATDGRTVRRLSVEISFRGTTIERHDNLVFDATRETDFFATINRDSTLVIALDPDLMADLPAHDADLVAFQDSAAQAARGGLAAGADTLVNITAAEPGETGNRIAITVSPGHASRNFLGAANAASIRVSAREPGAPGGLIAVGVTGDASAVVVSVQDAAGNVRTYGGGGTPLDTAARVVAALAADPAITVTRRGDVLPAATAGRLALQPTVTVTVASEGVATEDFPDLEDANAVVAALDASETLVAALNGGADGTRRPDTGTANSFFLSGGRNAGPARRYRGQDHPGTNVIELLPAPGADAAAARLQIAAGTRAGTVRLRIGVQRSGEFVEQESFDNLSMDPDDPLYLPATLASSSGMVRALDLFVRRGASHLPRASLAPQRFTGGTMPSLPAWQAATDALASVSDVDLVLAGLQSWRDAALAHVDVQRGLSAHATTQSDLARNRIAIASVNPQTQEEPAAILQHAAEVANRRLILVAPGGADGAIAVGSSRVDLQACKLEYSIVSPK